MKFDFSEMWLSEKTSNRLRSVTGNPIISQMINSISALSRVSNFVDSIFVYFGFKSRNVYLGTHGKFVSACLRLSSSCSEERSDCFDGSAISLARPSSAIHYGNIHRFLIEWVQFSNKSVHYSQSKTIFPLSKFHSVIIFLDRIC